MQVLVVLPTYSFAVAMYLVLQCWQECVPLPTYHVQFCVEVPDCISDVLLVLLVRLMV